MTKYQSWILLFSVLSKRIHCLFLGIGRQKRKANILKRLKILKLILNFKSFKIYFLVVIDVVFGDRISYPIAYAIARMWMTWLQAAVEIAAQQRPQTNPNVAPFIVSSEFAVI